MLASERVGRLLWKLSIPAIIGMMVHGLYNIVDTFFIGRFAGTLGIGGISIAFPVQMIIMGVVHLLLAMFTVQLAILANLGQEARLHSSIGWALGLYLLSVIAWLIHFWRHFSKT